MKSKRITTNELAVMMKEGFDEQGGQIAQQSSQIAQLGKQIADLVIAMKLGFEEQGKQIMNLASTVAELKEEVFKNGDALAKLTTRVDDEFAANLTAHDRMERKTETRFDRIDGRLDRIEHRLDLAPIPFPAN